MDRTSEKYVKDAFSSFSFLMTARKWAGWRLTHASSTSFQTDAHVTVQLNIQKKALTSLFYIYILTTAHAWLVLH